MFHVKVYRPSHPKATASGEIYAHVAIAEKALGHFLPDGAEVHHVDCNPRHNCNYNLVICQDKAYHKLLHVRMRIRERGGDPNVHRLCAMCEELKEFHEFNRSSANKSTGLQQRCRECQRMYWTTYRPRRQREVLSGIQ